MNKTSVHLALSLHLQERIDGLTTILKETYASTAEDSKSSAGDKHETAVSMAQLEQEKLTKQINEFLELQSTLLKINPERKHTSIELGSLVETNNGWYYFSIGLGAVPMNDSPFFAMNPLAPIGKLLLGKKAGEKVEFNGNVTEILSVC
jgi:transcription elongation GreA/GreB family factor